MARSMGNTQVTPTSPATPPLMSLAGRLASNRKEQINESIPTKNIVIVFLMLSIDPNTFFHFTFVQNQGTALKVKINDKRGNVRLTLVYKS